MHFALKQNTGVQTASVFLCLTMKNNTELLAPPVKPGGRMQKFKKHLRTVLLFVLYLSLCFFCAKFAQRCLGDFGNVTTTAVITIFLCFFIASKKAYRFIILPLAVLCLIYGPVGFLYGYPDYQALISLCSTTSEESKEFLTLIPAKYFLYAFIPLFGSTLAYMLSVKAGLKPWKNKTLLLCCIFILICICRPTLFFNKLDQGVRDVAQTYRELGKLTRESGWGVSRTVHEDKEYVLVIGESARPDYFHRYGYPLGNTPFIDKVPHTAVCGMTSAGVYTVGSLTNMLTMCDRNRWYPRYNYTMMDLVSSAGIPNTWISNQGKFGKHDTPIANLAKKAQRTKFLTHGRYLDADNSDYLLVGELKKVLDEKVTGKRLTILHTLGSHPNACKRVKDIEDPYRVTDPKYDYVACYVTSILKTDRLLERIYDELREHEKKTGRAFSILYFSDHGLAHITESDGRVVISNHETSRLHFNVPLIKIDSTDTDRRMMYSKKSGLRFTEGIASWLGIENEHLGQYDYFDGKDDPEDYGLQKRIDSFSKPLDPAIDLTPLLK